MIQLGIGQIAVGEPSSTTAGLVVPRGGPQADQIVSQLHGRWYEANRIGRLWGIGISNTALVNANAIATGLTATAQPIIGLYNPSTSAVILELCLLHLVESVISNTAVAPGGFAWVSSVGNNAISTGGAGINMKTLTTTGPLGAGVAKVFTGGVAVTGLTTNLAFLRGVNHGGLNAAGPATAITQPQYTIEPVDGSIIVPAGGIVGVMCALATTTVAVTTSLLWMENPTA